MEDVKAYVNFIKSTVGITHEDELVRTIEILAQQVHPLALGNVERFLSQSRMIARKILRTHMKDADDHTIDDIIENMASKLYFHGHPINRQEAKNDLRLKVNLDLPPELETMIWDLYQEYEKELKNLDTFNPAGDLAGMPSQGPQRQAEYEILHAVVESARLTSRYTTQRRFSLVQVPQAGQVLIHEDVLSQGWSHSMVP